MPATRKVGFIVIAGLLANAVLRVERYLIVIPSMAFPELPYPAGIFFPSWEDISVTAAGFAGFALLLILLSRLVPLISLWEYSEAEAPPEGPAEPPELTLGSLRASGSEEAPASPDAANFGTASMAGGLTAKEGIQI